MTGAAGSVTSTTFAVTIGGVPTGIVAVVITLSGLKLGVAVAAANAGTFTLVSTADTLASGTAVAPAILNSIAVASVTLAYNGVGSAIWPVITFSSTTSLAIGSTITITQPQGYFLGTASFPVGSIALMTGTAASAAIATSTSIVITTAGAASTTGQAIITLTGLTLGAAQVANTLVFSSSLDAGTVAIAVPAIVAGVTAFTLAPGYNTATSRVWPVLSFTSATQVAISGTFTLTMPTDYFTGAAAFAAGAASVAQAVGTSSAISTAITFTLTGAATGTTAFTVTLSGLTLGAIQVAGAFGLATSTMSATVAIAAPAIVAGVTGVSLASGYAGVGSSVWPVLTFSAATNFAIAGTITIAFPAGYFIGTATFAAGAASVATMTGAAAASTSTSTSIVITTAVIASGTGSFIVTLSGLTLGAVQAAGAFGVSTSGMTAVVAIAAPAIFAATPFTMSIVKTATPTESSNVATTAVDVIISFTPSVTVGSGQAIILSMPAGYFTGTGATAAQKSTVSTLTASTNAATSTTTTLTITTAVIATGTAAFTITVTGLSLGAAQAAGYVGLTTTVEFGSVSKMVPQLFSTVMATATTSITFGNNNNVSGSDPKPILTFTPLSTIDIGGSITIAMPTGYFLGTASFAAGAASVATMTGTAAAAATSTSTSIVITTAVVASGAAAFTVTLSGLTLGSSRDAGTFQLSTSVDGGWVYKPAPAIKPVPAPPPPVPRRLLSPFLSHCSLW